MAATGNEVVRLEQLKRLQPQIVSINYNKTASIKLGNGEIVTFSTSGDFYIDLLVRAMYNSFELLQASSSGYRIEVDVKSEVPMKTFKMKTRGENDGVFYGVTNNELNSFNISSGNKISLIPTNDLVLFIGAVIYVE